MASVWEGRGAQWAPSHAVVTGCLHVRCVCSSAWSASHRPIGITKLFKELSLVCRLVGAHSSSCTMASTGLEFGALSRN